MFPSFIESRRTSVRSASALLSLKKKVVYGLSVILSESTDQDDTVFKKASGSDTGCVGDWREHRLILSLWKEISLVYG